MLNRSTRRLSDGFTICGGAEAPTRIYRSGGDVFPDKNDCISISVLNRAQFFWMLWFVVFGLGTKFRPRPRRLVVFGGGCIIVHKLCTEVFVQRMKKCDLGRLAIMFAALCFVDKYGLAMNPYAFRMLLRATCLQVFATCWYHVSGLSSSVVGWL
jgi:hypothetical protein